MAREFAESFYKSAAWVKCRDAYVRKVGGLCERCWKMGRISHGEIVHHKIHLTPENIRDPKITLNFDNLELSCRKCHGADHSKRQRRYQVDKDGNVYIPPLNE